MQLSKPGAVRRRWARCQMFRPRLLQWCGQLGECSSVFNGTLKQFQMSSGAGLPQHFYISQAEI